MKSLALAAISLCLAAGAASASTTVPRVDAVADLLAADSLSVACSDPHIRASDVGTVLGTQDAIKTAYLRQSLGRAVVEACGQNVASIVVTKRGMQVDWRPALAGDAAVAIALR